MLAEATRLDIARRFLPSRWHYHYVRAKLATDPLYPAVTAALSMTDAPVLDLGCGMGLAAHCAREAGLALPWFGVDNDAGKIRLARDAASRAGLAQVRFETVDLTREVPLHAGSVLILDLLQFLPPVARPALLEQAAGRVTAGGRLILRTGLDDAGWRARLTRLADGFSRAVRWMNVGPQGYPTRQGLEATLAGAGLEVQFTPLYGRTPFNNWLVIARRSRPG